MLNVILNVLTIGGSIVMVWKFDKVRVLLGQGEEVGLATDSPRTEGTILTDARSTGKSEMTTDAKKMQV